MSEREIMDAKNGIVARESYGFRDEVVKNVYKKSLWMLCYTYKPQEKS
jgi:hypothetical protein